MTQRSMIEKLKGHFGKGFRKKLAREETMEGVVDRLERKQRKLEKKLADETSTSQRKLLGQKIKLLRAQRKKAEELAESQET